MHDTLTFIFLQRVARSLSISTRPFLHQLQRMQILLKAHIATASLSPELIKGIQGSARMTSMTNKTVHVSKYVVKVRNPDKRSGTKYTRKKVLSVQCSRIISSLPFYPCSGAIFIINKVGISIFDLSSKGALFLSEKAFFCSKRTLFL